MLVANLGTSSSAAMLRALKRQHDFMPEAVRCSARARAFAHAFGAYCYPTPRTRAHDSVYARANECTR